MGNLSVNDGRHRVGNIVDLPGGKFRAVDMAGRDRGTHQTVKDAGRALLSLQAHLDVALADLRGRGVTPTQLNVIAWLTDAGMPSDLAGAIAALNKAQP